MGAGKGNYYAICFLLQAYLVLAMATPAFARKTNGPLYQEAFDLAAGGASLTRASQEGIIYSNPALLPLGSAWVRWFGTQFGVMADQQLTQDLLGGDTGGSEEDFLNRSAHVGQSLALSFLNQNFAISVFDRVELDISSDKFADGGLPALNVKAEAYAGGVVSVASRPMPWLSLGVTGKYIIAAEPEILIPLADQEELSSVMQNPSQLKEQLQYGQGIGIDVGSLFFFQGRNLDYSFALKVDDLANTSLAGRDPFYQTVSAGFGMAFHGKTEVLHLALDYRDILDVYEERPFKKLYIGARLLVRQMFGLAAGFHQGIPTAGVKLDLIFFKIGLTAYGRELGNYPGERQRNLYYAYMALGI
ncbi:MAG: hypothetical protein ACOH5I_16875 [Oligoflexus sp.]